MKIRYLPRWPPRWTGSAGPFPRGNVGVLESVEWRADLQGARDVQVTLEYEGYLWRGRYPETGEIRAQVGEAALERLYAVLARSLGQEIARVAELEVEWAQRGASPPGAESGRDERAATTEETIRRRIRARLTAGTLPRDLPPFGSGAASTMLIKLGQGQPCAACGEGDADFSYSYPDRDLPLHRRCDELWNEERQLSSGINPVDR